MNIWSFYDYLIEFKRRDEIASLWQNYMAKCVSAGFKDFPQYYDLVQNFISNKPKETPQEAVSRIIDKINKEVED